MRLTKRKAHGRDFVVVKSLDKMKRIFTNAKDVVMRGRILAINVADYIVDGYKYFIGADFIKMLQEIGYRVLVTYKNGYIIPLGVKIDYREGQKIDLKRKLYNNETNNLREKI